MVFKGNLLIIGCGAVSQCAVPLILRHMEMPPEKITIMDFADNRDRVAAALARGVNYVLNRITPDNYRRLLASCVRPGDMIIDLAWNIDTLAMIEWCRDQQVLYVNASIEDWDPYADEERNDPTRYTLYARHMRIRRKLRQWGDGHRTATAIVDHGANPGLVSHFTKQALLDIAGKILREKPEDRRASALTAALAEQAFAALARLTGVKTIHISERDTQITDKPKEPGEFVNTWSTEGLYEEAVAPAELGWGTHEYYVPENTYFHTAGPRNQICLGTIGMKTWARSWVPSGEIIGMVIRHGEAFGISDRLTVREDGRLLYRPTVHYVYCPCDATVNSLHELEMRQYRLQEKQRILKEEIIDGRDELGVLLMGHDYNSWWCGSRLDIHTARALVPDQQATTLQVACAVVAAAVWMIENPRRGFLLPDDVDHRPILNFCRPYIEPFVSMPVDWTPLTNLNTRFTKFDIPLPGERDLWQFTTFLTDPRPGSRSALTKGIVKDV